MIEKNSHVVLMIDENARHLYDAYFFSSPKDLVITFTDYDFYEESLLRSRDIDHVFVNPSFFRCDVSKLDKFVQIVLKLDVTVTVLCNYESSNGLIINYIKWKYKDTFQFYDGYLTINSLVSYLSQKPKLYKSISCLDENKIAFHSNTEKRTIAIEYAVNSYVELISFVEHANSSICVASNSHIKKVILISVSSSALKNIYSFFRKNSGAYNDLTFNSCYKLYFMVGDELNTDYLEDIFKLSMLGFEFVLDVVSSNNVVLSDCISLPFDVFLLRDEQSNISLVSNNLRIHNNYEQSKVTLIYDTVKIIEKSKLSDLFNLISRKTKKWNCLIVDDHPIISIALQQKLVRLGSFSNVHIATSSNEAIKIFRNNLIDFLIIDVNLGKDSGFILYKKLMNNGFSGKCIFISGEDNASYQMISERLGVEAFIVKSSDTNEMEKFIKDVLVSRKVSKSIETDDSLSLLSKQEIAVAGYLCKGYSNKAISSELNIDQKTVSTYKSRIFKKLDVTSVVELTKIFSLLI